MDLDLRFYLFGPRQCFYYIDYIPSILLGTSKADMLRHGGSSCFPIIDMRRGLVLGVVWD